jgi:hypothetical protein
MLTVFFGQIFSYKHDSICLDLKNEMSIPMPLFYSTRQIMLYSIDEMLYYNSQKMLILSKKVLFEGFTRNIFALL